MMALLTVGCHQKDSASNGGGKYTIKGKITGGVNGELILCRIMLPDAKPDTAFLAKDGSFTFNNTIEEPVIASIYFPTSITEKESGISLYLEQGNIEIEAQKDNLEKAKVSGGVNNSTLKEVLDIIAKYGQKMKLADDSLKIAFGAHNNAIVAEIQQREQDLEVAEKEEIATQVKKYPKAYTSAYFAYLLGSGNEKAEPLYKSLDPTVQASYFGKKLKESLEAMKATTIGSVAPEFSSMSVEGKPLTLASFKGKYVLLDFWASWCGPCRQENPNVVKAYKQFKDKNFAILGVSLDEDKTAWMRAIATDNLTWNHVSDLQGWKSSTAALYGIQGIPANFLIDPSGKIIAKDLRGEALITKLAAVFK